MKLVAVEQRFEQGETRMYIVLSDGANEMHIRVSKNDFDRCHAYLKNAYARGRVPVQRFPVPPTGHVGPMSAVPEDLLSLIVPDILLEVAKEAANANPGPRLVQSPGSVFKPVQQPDDLDERDPGELLSTLTDEDGTEQF